MSNNSAMDVICAADVERHSPVVDAEQQLNCTGGAVGIDMP
jgi:hypothetical protein